MIHQKDLRLGDLVQITVDLPEYKRGDIPFAIFKGLTDNFAFSEYCNFIERITDFLLLPVTRWQDRKNRYEELKRTSEWYRKGNKRLNDILDNNIPNNKSCKQ